MPAEEPPPIGDVDSTFETLAPPPAAQGGEPSYRGTHQYEDRTVERTYHVTDGLVRVETAYLDGERELTVSEECWLLAGDGQTVRQTDQPIAAFCRDHHFEQPAADVAFWGIEPDGETDPLPDAEVTSTFQPATSVRIDDGAALQYEGQHRAGEARVERSFFVSESNQRLRIRTRYAWAGESLGSVEVSKSLLEDGEYVAATGEPIGAFCRRTHLAEPEADLRYCARLGTGQSWSEPPGG